MFLRFAYVELFFILVPIFIGALLYRLLWYRQPRYAYPLASSLRSTVVVKKTSHKKILAFLRAATLIGLMMLIPRPQWVDERSVISVDGVDIVLALDMSGSMRLFDDLKDTRPRIDVAKTEAIRFIERRTNDPIGIVIFARDALSRCPLTLDKKFLKDIVGSLKLGFINPEGTALGTGLATAINRLKNSKAKSRIVILLTDGSPTPGDRVEPDMAIELAKEFGIKVYTVGIGSEKGGYLYHPFGGVQQADTSFNEKLLQEIATETGGKYFRASSPKDMRLIYDKIDQLETTKHETDMFHNYYEAFLTFIWIVLLLLAGECILRFFVWRGV